MKRAFFLVVLAACATAPVRDDGAAAALRAYFASTGDARAPALEKLDALPVPRDARERARLLREALAKAPPATGP
jgi:hypothetical protein